ncbi:MAG: helix-turn-helix domain-containing protein [Candidatus Methylomirabilis sp.]|nr:helix-turn-helix domain-containing protein [Deltaproteobacteria bacterium]
MANVNPNPSILLDEREAARLLALAVKTLRRWRWEGQGPAFLKLGGAVRYERAELERFIAGSRRSSTSDRGAGR